MAGVLNQILSGYKKINEITFLRFVFLRFVFDNHSSKYANHCTLSTWDTGNKHIPELLVCGLPTLHSLTPGAVNVGNTRDIPVEVSRWQPYRPRWDHTEGPGLCTFLDIPSSPRSQWTATEHFSHYTWHLSFNSLGWQIWQFGCIDSMFVSVIQYCE